MYTIKPIAFVKNNRKKVEDDFWGDVISEIIISDKISEESLKGIQEFSHLEIIFYFHLADPQRLIFQRHIREKIKNFRGSEYLHKGKTPGRIFWAPQL